MFRSISTLSNGIRLPFSVFLTSKPSACSNDQFLNTIDSRRLAIRYYCKEREPRVFHRNPVPMHRRIELPNPEFTDKTPKPLDSLTYFDDDAQTGTEPEEPDVLYSSIEIETRGHDTAVLKSYETFALMAAKYLDITVSKVYVPREPYIWWMRTLLRSVHIFKKRRFQYETRTYYRRFTIVRVTGSTTDTFLEYIQRNLPEGVGMRVMRRVFVERPDYLKQPPKGAIAQAVMENQQSVPSKKSSQSNVIV